jgi:vanillate O-demethylase monooxygenase subunit
MDQRIYPLNTERPWPLNQWWVAARADEVTRNPMERTILGQPVVLYRTEADDPVAMAGLCPHRGYPMVRGKVVGDSLECAYHGFTFGCKGGCERIPSQDSVPPNWKIRTYPVAQRWEWIWIWTGDPALADTTKIPDPWCVGKPGWRSTVGRCAPLKGRYTLLIDNLFDLSHLNYIHASIVGDQTAIVRTPVEMTTQADGAFRLSRHVHHAPFGPFFAFQFPHKAQEAPAIYTELISVYYGPSLIVTGGPFHVEGGDPLGEANYLHAMTPETTSSTHYFYGITRDFRVDDDDFDAAMLANDAAVRQQDLDAIALVEPNVDRFLDTARELSALQDAGGIRVRRMLAAQINAEPAPEQGVAIHRSPARPTPQGQPS